MNVQMELNPDRKLIKEKNLNFYTNFAAEDKEAYVDAILEYWADYQEDDLFLISDYAYDVYGRRVNDYHSLWVSFDNKLYTSKYYKIFRTILRKHIQKRLKRYYSNRGFITEAEFSL